MATNPVGRCLTVWIFMSAAALAQPVPTATQKARSLAEKLNQAAKPSADFAAQLEKPVKGAPAPKKWSTLTHPSGDFTIDMPDNPVEPPPLIQKTDMLSFASLSPQYKCMVSYRPIHESMLALENEQAILDQITKALSGAGVKVNAFRSGDFLGADTTTEPSPGVFQYSRSVFLNRYAVDLTIVTMQREFPKSLDRFWSSFKILIPHTDSTKPPAPYLERLAAFTTVLRRQGPAPHSSSTLPPPPAGFVEQMYKSGERSNKAWVALPKGEGPHPVIVYCHQGFELASSDADACQIFRDAGLAVMLPSWRGENGNPGEFEFLLGEVDDACAAVRWLASQPTVDKNRIYAFGFFHGGAIADGLALRKDLPLVHSGSCSGLLNADYLNYKFKDLEPYDFRHRDERDMRLLSSNIRDIQRHHFAYLGRQDRNFVPDLLRDLNQASKASGRSLLKAVEVPGSHRDCLSGVLQRYLNDIQTYPTADKLPAREDRDKN